MTFWKQAKKKINKHEWSAVISARIDNSTYVKRETPFVSIKSV